LHTYKNYKEIVKMRGIKCNDEKRYFVTFGEKFIKAFGIESLTVWAVNEEAAVEYLEQQLDLEVVFEKEYEEGNFDGIFEDIEPAKPIRKKTTK
jgi:hypothetical protein